VQADPNQMNQVLMNLCLNARDAMPGGGQIVASLHNRVLTPEYAALHLEGRPGEFVELSVRDTGEGIPADIARAPASRSIFPAINARSERADSTGILLRDADVRR
jgi:signal transduction histidine kinase